MSITKKLTQEEMRDVCWSIGKAWDPSYRTDFIALSTIYPHSGFLQWNSKNAHLIEGGEYVVRLYDVTDLDFDGGNAHSYTDSGVETSSGSYFFNVPQLERYYIAEFGVRKWDGYFEALLRSEAVFFDRDKPSSNFNEEALFISKFSKSKISVESLFDSAAYDAFQKSLEALVEKRGEGSEQLKVVVAISSSDEELIQYLDEISYEQEVSGLEVDSLAFQYDEKLLFTKVIKGANGAFPDVSNEVDCIHCHNWGSFDWGIKAAKRGKIPLVVSLHEKGASLKAMTKRQLQSIDKLKREAFEIAAQIIVPNDSYKGGLVSDYGVPEDKVTVVPDIYDEFREDPFDPGKVKSEMHLHPEWPTALFAAEISHSSGADLLVNAIKDTNAQLPEAQFIFAGEGPLKGELENDINYSGMGHKCRFLGDVDGGYFDSILATVDYVVLPGRTWQDSGLVERALALGKPVLTTHQSHIDGVQHGENGLMTYDNPGSIIWGLKELFSNNLQGSMMRIAARRKAGANETKALAAILTNTVIVNAIQ